MTKTRAFSGLFLCLALTACFEAEEFKSPADVDGNCTALFIGEYNQTTKDLEALKEDSENQKLKKQALSSCQSFAAKYDKTSDLSCKVNGERSVESKSLLAQCAELKAKNNEEVVTEPSDVADPSGEGATNPSGETANQEEGGDNGGQDSVLTPVIPNPEDALKDLGKNKSEKQPTTPLVQVGDETLLQDFAAGRMVFEVVSQIKVQSVKKSKKGEEKVFFDGKVVGLKNIAKELNETDATYCDIYDPQNSLLVNGAKLQGIEKVEAPLQVPGKKAVGQVKIYFMDVKIAIRCAKKETTPFRLKDIRQALKGSFEIRLQN